MVAAAVPLVPVNMATVALESFFYGTFFVLFIISVSLLVSRYVQDGRRGGKKSSLLVSPLFIGAIALFITVTSHWIITVDRAFLAFFHFEDGTFPLGFYGDLSQITEVVKTGFLMASLTIGDLLIIHRLWTVWGHNKYIVIFPLCTLMGLTACGVGITYQFTQYHPGQNVFLSEAGRWITSDAVFTLWYGGRHVRGHRGAQVLLFSTNVYSTVLISWHIWRTSRQIRPYGGQNMASVLSIVLESAAIYTSWTLFFFVSYQSQSNLQFIAVDCWPAMSGISCMLIHVRVGMRGAQKSIQSSSIAPATLPAPPQPFSVSITRAVHTNDDYQLEEMRGGGSKADMV
ncbi:hypothetical protein C8R45DRAFT_507451 [Mycena sanguinolenta]|nr:hypothetical protein C8R45DRAFT_507451 [Mycena sanguinolenta]